jgi:hypothetical protein
MFDGNVMLNRAVLKFLDLSRTLRPARWGVNEGRGQVCLIEERKESGEGQEND